MSDAYVVGSGPNGLAAAITLAEAGRDVTVFEAHDQIGGGTRSAELTVPGVIHDVCSAVHPFALASPFLSRLPLAERGLEWCYPEVDLAHPLDGGTAGVVVRSLDETVAGLGEDGVTWRAVFGPLVDDFDKLTAEVLAPILHRPRHPIALARFGLRAATPAALLARRFQTPEARALFAGSAAHIFRPLNRPGSSAIGVLLTAAAHRVGWPVAKGGSASITHAMAGYLTMLGGTIETAHRIDSIDEFAPGSTVLLDLSPTGATRVIGDRLPSGVARAYERWKDGPAAFKLDLAVEGGVPWTNEACRRAGTVHVGGTLEEVSAAEAAVVGGKMPDHPFVLVGQQYLCDPGRSNGSIHPIWTYAHVPAGYDGDASEAIITQIERFAPGLRDRIVAQATMSPADFERYNANYRGGDILTGANTVRQLVFRPRGGLSPYATGVPGVFLCSAATPPGAGVHGMGGHLAAQAALEEG